MTGVSANRLVRAVILSALVVMPSLASAQESPPVRFSDARLDLTCTDLSKGRAVQIVNSTAVEQEAIVGLDLASACGGLSLDVSELVIPAGRSGRVTLTASSAKEPETSTSDALVVFASSGGLASRLPISIPGKSAPAKPLVASVTAVETHDDDRATYFWVPLDMPEGSKPSLSTSQAIGALTGTQGQALVYFRATKKQDGRIFAGLEANRLRAGEYTGSADLIPDDDAGGVDLTLTVKEHWWKALVALLAGIALAILAQAIAGVWNSRRKLRAQTGLIEVAYRQALRAVLGTDEQVVHPPGSWRNSTITDIEEVMRGLRDTVDAKTNGAWISLDQKDVDALVAAIDAEQARVARFKEVATECTGIEDALEATAETLGREPLPDPPIAGQEEPALVAAAREQLKPYAIKLSDLETTIPTLTASRTDVLAVGLLLRRFSGLLSDLHTLQRLYPRGPARERVDGLLRELTALYRSLWGTTDVEEAKSLSRDLWRLDKRMDRLWPTQLAAVEYGADGTETLRLYGFRNVTSPTETDMYFNAGRTPDTVFPAPASASIPPVIELARRDAERARWLELATVGVGLIVAVVTAMDVLYVGEPWGSEWDYVKIVTWGLLTPTAITAITAAINNVGGFTSLIRRLRGAVAR
jgi:hypothetical protein